MRRLTIAGLIAASTLGSVVLVAGAPVIGVPRAPFWPALKDGPAVVQEWYSDIPWHQKLGTYAGNEIDAVLVLPYDALGEAEKNFCTSNQIVHKPHCMLEVGINNVIGMLRTDTPYATDDPKIKAANECQDSMPCIEVKLDVSSFWTRVDGSSVVLLPRPFGIEPQIGPYNANYRGYAITDGSTYGPQMPWYMSHYCDSKFPGSDVQDPVCYGDYLSPMNSGFNALPGAPGGSEGWPRSVPWSVWPKAPTPAPDNHCAAGYLTCTIVMAGFPFSELQSNPELLQYKTYNDFLLGWFNGALASFRTDVSPAELQRHFPWSGNPVTWETFYQQGVQNPFLGQYLSTTPGLSNPSPCTVTAGGTGNPLCANTGNQMASLYLYPRQCTMAHLAGGNAAKLRQCSLNYELHHNGYMSQWPSTFWPDLDTAGMLANQYGRTSFLFAGVPGMQLPVPFYKDSTSDSGLSIYEQVYNASIFSLYLPIANVADTKNAFPNRNYTDKEFYHTLLMVNHMESDPFEFADGIRGKVLWHDEYRTQKMYEAYANKTSEAFPTEKFAASFVADTAPSPYHNSTCDGCHVRNGSGIPINTKGILDPALQEFMSGSVYKPYQVKDYTFTGEIRPMKLVFFDLQRDTTRVDASRYSEPLAFAANFVAHPPRNVQAGDLYYNNKIMNFYGDSFHVTRAGYDYRWSFEPLDPNRLVVAARRVNSELGKTYQLWQIKLETFTTSSTCQLVLPAPTRKPWPGTCGDIDDAAIHAAIDGGAVGFMHLNGKRLGNLSAIEAIPNDAIQSFQATQIAALGPTIAGEIVWNAGSRGGVNGTVRKNCRTNSLTDCYIGRFGWIGDRVSIEDQVANAAFVEMNITTNEGYKQLYGNEKVMFPIRYDYPNCGPADKVCIESSGNSKLSEKDVDRMADYARWLGNPTRSEFQVTLPEVIAGERIFRQVKCDTCHVIKKIPITPDGTMLTKVFRDRLTARMASEPFLSYIGTDLLMHDMGYLSQVGTSAQPIRDPNNGVVLPTFQNYVQKIRTPPLKGLRFNRFVTDSHKNTKTASTPAIPQDPACDFLLHDGRACDAIEAAFLHDGPAIKKLGVIEGLNGLTPTDLTNLRAFLYSL